MTDPKRTFKQVSEDKLTSWAAALTCYGILSMFPGLLVLIAPLRLGGHATTQRVLVNVTSIAPGPARTILTSAVKNLQQSQSSTAGILALVGVLGAVWSASGYVGSFMQAANSIYDVPEGRPTWKATDAARDHHCCRPHCRRRRPDGRFTGSLARRAGDLIGLGSTAVTVWDIAKWPVLVILISLLFALLYWAGPNAKRGGFRWMSPGSTLAVVLWIAASAGFALYVPNFSSYNEVPGAAGVRTFGSISTASCEIRASVPRCASSSRARPR